MNKIIIIIPYFGKLPNYFQLWLKSVKYNSTVNFLLVTDDKTNYNYPNNVKVIYTSFVSMQNKIKNIFGNKVKIKEPYKLCDYRPLYNIIFSDEIIDYDFWGYCDLDIIFGNIRKFLKDEILKKYEKIYTRGHLTIFKNSKKINQIINSEKIRIYYNYKEALSTNYMCHFDEWGGISGIFKEENIEQYDEIDFADLDMKKYNFHMLFRKELKEKNEIFEWNNGHLYFITEDGIKNEIIYAHFQKRKMKIEMPDMNVEKFLIVPNKFINYQVLTKELIESNTKIRKINCTYYKKRICGLIEKIRKDAIKQRLYRIRKRYTVKNNIPNN